MKHRLTACIVGSFLAVSGCSSDGAFDEDQSLKTSGEGTNSLNNGAGGQGPNSPNDGDGFVAEREETFTLATPTVIDDEVWIANETLNSVAVIDGRSLRIRSIPVGFRPGDIVGPKTAGTGRVMVLNEGSSSVTVIDPQTDSTQHERVLPHANKLVGNESATFAMAWYDADEGELPLTQLGDVLSTTSLISAAGGAYSLAVGFNVRSVVFSADGERALVLSDDGVSVIDPSSVSADALAPPIGLEILGSSDKVEDVELAVDADAKFVLARAAGHASLTMLDVDAETEHVVELPEVPTDLDIINTESGTTAYVVLRDTSRVLAISLPEGIIAAELAWKGILDPAPMDMAMADADVGTDAGADMSDSADAANNTLPDAAGVSVFDLPVADLGSAVVSSDGSIAVVFGTIGGLKEAVLLTLATGEARVLYLDKGVRGALAEPDGGSFVLFHDREEGGVPAGANPTDPEFIARSWGVSLVDAATATTRLLLTESEPGPTTLFATAEYRKLFIAFVAPETGILPSARDVTQVDLNTFSVNTFRVPDLPETLGTIESAERVFIGQRHPTGRLTFVNMSNDSRNTVTGFQLNAGID